ncbi:MAG: hypothetical protein ACK4NY_03390 [Spirosomataceae bacterium]
MTTIQIEVKDSLAQSLGLKAIQEHFRKELELLEIELLAQKLNDSISVSGVDWNEELENARRDAYIEYQNKK